MEYDEILKMDKDLLAAASYALVTVLFAFLPIISQTPISSALGLGLVLFVTGYVIIAAVFPGRDSVGAMTRAVLSCGLGIMTACITGLVLHVSPIGFSPNMLAICLGTLTIASVAIAYHRRLSLKPEARFTVHVGKAYQDIVAFFSGESRLNQVLIIVLTLAILISISALAYAVIVPAHGQPFTEFYVLGPDGKAGHYPDKIRPGESSPVIIGITSHEYQDVTYDLVVTLNDSVNTSRLYQESFQLASGQTWQKRIELKPDLVGMNEKIELLLYADGNYTAPYRELRMWVDVTQPLY